MKKHRILIIGSGIAGLSCALKLASKLKNGHPLFEITLVSKSTADEGATRYAQGGIASVWSKSDTFEEHVQDTLSAGAGLCDPETVRICITEGPERVRELIELGVQFTRYSENNIEYDLHKEGGHGKRRILHADDLTGLAIEKALLENAKNTQNIEFLENHTAIDLITEGKVLGRFRKPGRVLGAYLLNNTTKEVITFSAASTILATGGAGKVYLYTSNPNVSTGDGIAMAYRAHAKIVNMEFMQFHPTCLFHPNQKTFLITEALRGEGAVLKNKLGQEFMKNYHPLESLAPRDVVARAIDSELKKTGDLHVILDATALLKKDPKLLEKKFPNIFHTCQNLGIDLSLGQIPVVPAAHYTCGGIATDLNGMSSIENLYAVGECAYTGLHGANRLASNSLLEAVVFAHRAAEKITSNVLTGSRHKDLPRTSTQYKLPDWESGMAVPIEEQIDITANWLEIRNLMWNYVGIVRSDRRLERALRRIELLKTEVNAYYWNFLLTQDLIELRNLITVAEIITRSAAIRKESRGLHFNVDYPERDDRYYSQPTVI